MEIDGEKYPFAPFLDKIALLYSFSACFISELFSIIVLNKSRIFS